MAGKGKAVGHHAEHVAEQDEHEESENEGEILAPFGADRVAQQIGAEFEAHLGDRLPATRHQRAFARADGHQRNHEQHGNHHHHRRIGEGNVVAADINRNQFLDFELLKRAMAACAAVFPAVFSACIRCQRSAPVPSKFCHTSPPGLSSPSGGLRYPTVLPCPVATR